MSVPVILLIFQVILNVSEALDDNLTETNRLRTCRTGRGIHTSFDLYIRDTCTWCYLYMPLGAFTKKFRGSEYIGFLMNPSDKQIYETDPDNISLPILESFSSEDFTEKWVSCCRAARECCERMIEIDEAVVEGESHCPRTWDGWQCWPDTPGGSIAKAPCPEHIYFKSDPPACTRVAISMASSVVKKEGFCPQISC